MLCVVVAHEVVAGVLNLLQCVRACILRFAPLCNLRVAVSCSVLQCIAVRCSALQCVAVCCSVRLKWHSNVKLTCCSVLQCVAVCCSVLQCSACEAVPCSIYLCNLSFRLLLLNQHVLMRVNVLCDASVFFYVCVCVCVFVYVYVCV